MVLSQRALLGVSRNRLTVLEAWIVVLGTRDRSVTMQRILGGYLPSPQGLVLMDIIHHGDLVGKH